jgi:hypothetical protein
VVLPEGEVVVLPEPVVPVEPPLPTVPEDEPPIPVEPVPVEPVPAEPVLEPAPALPPVLEPRSFRHCSFADASVSWSHFALAALLEAEPLVALEESLDDGEVVAPALEGEDALPELPELPPYVDCAAAIVVAARNAAATAACRIFIVIGVCSSSVEWIAALITV